MLRLLLFASLLSLAVGCPAERPSETPAPAGPSASPSEVRPRAVTVSVRPHATLPSESALVFLGFADADVDGGHPKQRKLPNWYWSSERLEIRPEMKLQVDMPDRTNLIVIVDANEDGRPSPGERSTQMLRGPGDAATFTATIDRSFGELWGDVRLSDVDPSEGSGVDAAPGRSTTFRIDADPRVKVAGGSILFVGYEDTELEGGKPMPDAQAWFFWRVIQDEITWPMTVAARVPREGKYFVVVDLDGDAQAGLGDLTTPALAPPDPRTGTDALEVVLDRTWTFAEEEEE